MLGYGYGKEDERNEGDEMPYWVIDDFCYSGSVIGPIKNFEGIAKAVKKIALSYMLIRNNDFLAPDWGEKSLVPLEPSLKHIREHVSVIKGEHIGSQFLSKEILTDVYEEQKQQLSEMKEKGLKEQRDQKMKKFLQLKKELEV